MFRAEVPSGERSPRVTTLGFAFDLELLVLINDGGHTVVEGPVKLDYQFSTTTGTAAVLSRRSGRSAASIGPGVLGRRPLRELRRQRLTTASTC